jgi:malto-oligosyltrehalose synthase
VQLPGLGFAGAAGLVDYLDQLGVETLYVSPVLAAVPGSTHGYDVVDPTRLDPALGTVADFEALLAALARHDMRLLIDIVPNHMAVHPENAWWWDVLEGGEHAASAPIFDIDWSAQGGRVLVPTLAEPLRSLLDRGAARITSGGGRRELVLDGQRFPLAPASVPGRAVRARRELEAVLARQHFRPAYWRLSRDEVNYRRFFDIDGLIGVRVEDPGVFDITHRCILELARDERIAGWRVDHVDGLADPGAYLSRLRAEVSARRTAPAVLLIEKILAPGETVRRRWEEDGTTGYEFAAVAGGLFVDPRGAALIERAGAEMAGEPRTFAELALASKREVIDRSFRAPVGQLVRLTTRALDTDRPGHDLSAASTGDALRELTVHLDAYRTYLDAGPVDRHDMTRLQRAAGVAAPVLGPEGRRALALVCAGLASSGADRASDALWREVARRWQQLSGAVMAKGVEDTATYRYPGLLGHAEVGCDAGRPATSPPAFHAAIGSRGRRHPSSLNATSTHDSKRSEDVRARLFALSELPDEWNRLVARWHRRHAPVIERAGGPDGHDELVAYQTLAAMWPTGRAQLSPEECTRVQQYMVKAAREGARRTGWSDPDVRYEGSLRTFVQRLSRSRREPFGSEMERLVGRIGPAAATNSLALTVLKAVCPGVPDVYQGTELWAFSLTDPDNRRPVDFGRRRALLAGLPGDEIPPAARQAGARALLADWTDGRIKLHVLRSLLTVRRAQPALFDRAAYRPLATSGPLRDHAVAVTRRHRRQWLVAVVPRLMLEAAGPGRFPTGTRLWGKTAVQLPAGAPVRFTDVLTGASVDAQGGALDAGRALATLPVAVLSGVAER